MKPVCLFNTFSKPHTLEQQTERLFFCVDCNCLYVRKNEGLLERVAEEEDLPELDEAEFVTQADLQAAVTDLQNQIDNMEEEQL